MAEQLNHQNLSNITRLLTLQSSGSRDLIGEALQSESISKSSVFNVLKDSLADKRQDRLHLESIRLLGNLMQDPEYKHEGLKVLANFLLSKPWYKPYQEAFLVIASQGEDGIATLEKVAEQRDQNIYSYREDFLSENTLKLGKEAVPVVAALIRNYGSLFFSDSEGLLDFFRSHPQASLSYLLNNLDKSDKNLNEACAALATISPQREAAVQRLIDTVKYSRGKMSRNALECLNYINTSALAANSLMDIASTVIRRINQPEMQVTPSQKEIIVDEEPASKSWFRKLLPFLRSRSKEAEETAEPVEQKGKKKDKYYEGIPRNVRQLKEIMQTIYRQSYEEVIHPFGGWETSTRAPEVLKALQDRVLPISILAIQIFSRYPQNEQFHHNAIDDVKELWENIAMAPGGEVFLESLHGTYTDPRFNNPALKKAILNLFHDLFNQFAYSIKYRAENPNVAQESGIIKGTYIFPPGFAEQRLKDLKQMLPSLLFFEEQDEGVSISRLMLSHAIEGYDEEICDLAVRAFDAGKNEWPVREALRVMHERDPHSSELWKRLDMLLVPNSGYDWHAVQDGLDIISKTAEGREVDHYLGKINTLSLHDASEAIRHVAMEALVKLDPTLYFVNKDKQ